MTARKLIQLLEALPPNTRIPVEPAVISALKDKSRPQFVSESEQDKIDSVILRKRSKRPEVCSLGRREKTVWPPVTGRSYWKLGRSAIWAGSEILPSSGRLVRRLTTCDSIPCRPAPSKCAGIAMRTG